MGRFEEQNNRMRANADLRQGYMGEAMNVALREISGVYESYASNPELSEATFWVAYYEHLSKSLPDDQTVKQELEAARQYRDEVFRPYT